MTRSLTRPLHVPPEQWERALNDFDTYRRELPRLLREGHADRYAIIKDDQVLGIRDTLEDSLEIAGDLCGTEPVATYKINQMDVERFAILDSQPQPGAEALCPS